MDKRYAADVLKWVTGLVALGLAGCTSPGNGDGATGPEAKPGGGTIVTPAAMRTEGKVVRTNEKLNFVVLDFGFKRLPRAGRRLNPKSSTTKFSFSFVPVSYTHLTLPTKA